MDGQDWVEAASASLLADLGQSYQSLPAQSGLSQAIFDAANPDIPTDHAALLEALSTTLSKPGVGDVVVRHFSSLLLDLIARWIGRRDVGVQEEEQRLSVVAAVCGTLPELWRTCLAFLNGSTFRASPLSHISLTQLVSLPVGRISNILLAYYRLLVADPSLPQRHTWPHDPLLSIATTYPDNGVRLLAIQVLALQMGWSESYRMQMEREHVGDVGSVDAPIVYGDEVVEGATRNLLVDGWLLPMHETRRAEQLLSYSSNQPLCRLEPYLCSRSALIANSLLLRDPSTPSSLIHVSTEATANALHSLIPLLQVGSPTLLSSTPSSGKTHLLHHLSSVLYPSAEPTHRILSIPLADTTIDVKSLIGTYVSSPTKPGTFEWMEGALAKAVRAGRWVVLDDIDRASMEMLVTVAGLARSLRPGRVGRRARLAVPGRQDIEAGDGFALFATRSTRPDAYTSPAFFGQQNFTEVVLAAPSNQDVLAILAAQFTRLPRSIVETLVNIWQELRPLARVPGPVKPRDIGLRDLEKWCARVQRNLPSQSVMDALHGNTLGLFANPVFQDEVLLEAVDIFMASFDSKLASTQQRAKMIGVVALAIFMDEERALALIDKRRPTLEHSPATRQLIIGRTSTPLAMSERERERKKTTSRPFALTRPSLILLERVAAASSLSEPTLLVGETGTGKTTAVQYIATACGKPLTVLNLSMQTESSDLLGGFKPIDATASARLLHARWQKLFCETFSMAKPQNGTYLEIAAKALSARKWARCADLWSSSARRAMEKLVKKDGDIMDGAESPRKKRKPNMRAAKAAVQWQALLVDIADFDLHHVKMNSKLVFSFIEGPLVKAMKSGEWILLDEVNLASQETLEAISTILEGPSASLVLTERGDVEPIKRHPDFRLFACMNPATDVGKKDLPPSLRTRFTELYVPPPDDDREALVSIVTQYIGDVAAGDKAVILDVAEMYLSLKRLSADKEIVDGANSAPHYSMRTLARSLTFGVETAPLFGLRRGLWEGCLMAFTMSLDQASIERAREVCSRFLLGPLKNAKAVLSQIPSLPLSADADDFIRFGPFWLRRGPVPPVAESRYVITPSVQAKLSDLARVILTHRYPVLIQGPTSAGKTSAVEYLARQTGHRFVRINNHEHTDIQEYLGTYVTDPKTGNLVFQEGLLVTAVRQGHWIVLDELNLAPTDVLEALNRLLDDNRELVIPETQEVITPHPNFILFATQNPPGLYAGRKVLSRAFRNRFLEVHFDDVPKNELETILCQRCLIAPSYAKKIVQVFEELRHRRQASRVFESKSSFATLRDLFRWAERGAVGYQQLAEDGYMLLAERGRQPEDKEVIKGVIEDVMKVKVDEQMYGDAATLSRLPFTAVPPSTLVWTKAMQRLFTLVASALAHNEPVLLVGETGCGKTSVCDVVAAAFQQTLVGVNCHQNMETADLLGSQRPVRNRLERRAKIVARLNEIVPVQATTDEELASIVASLLKRTDVDHAVVRSCANDLARLSALFEWSDGPLVHAMNQGDLLLLDEVSLADDSVLERLNSVLEPGRTLVLAEKGGNDIDAATIVAHDNFHVVATMNPGGDFGKKELSPALRNRFTEIWVPPLNDRADLMQIIGLSWKVEGMEVYGGLMLDFFAWFGERLGDAGMGLRDILAWVDFMNRIKHLSPADSFHHGGQMVVVDGLESLPQTSGLSTESMAELRKACLLTLDNLVQSVATTAPPALVVDESQITIGGFGIPRGALPVDEIEFRFNAPTTALNAMRVLRGCQLPKAILLEGSPGVGKTSLVAALAAVSGHRLQRINLSDQTDLIDLFGSDLPVEGGQPGEFQWRDAAFLDAMQKGDWVLLDEMNLASQTVLEGLNAVLDHRGTVYIPELGRGFDRHPDFRVFAAQNPLQQGGGRKGLPKSFLNRFTKVYLSEQTAEDLLLICQQLHPVPTATVQRMIQFNEEIRIQTMLTRTIGREGSPWEFNLRDLFRWFGLLAKGNGLETSLDPVEFLRMVYLHRFRNIADRQAVRKIFERVFGVDVPLVRPAAFVSPTLVQIGHSLLERGGVTDIIAPIRHEHLDVAESVLKAVEMGWLVILAGESGSGKRHLLESIAQRAGRDLGEFAMHPGVDTSEILGSFEQQDVGRLARITFDAIVDLLHALHPTKALPLLDAIRSAFLAGIEAFAETCRSVLESIDLDTTLALHALARLNEGRISLSGFAWNDGQLVHALRHGGWFLISEANLCSASVLDRLNSLCENNGSLVLSEKGSATGTPELIRPHPGFRLFMTYDPRFGELSRAMRNRGIELYVDHPDGRLQGTVHTAASTIVRSAMDVQSGNGPSKDANALAMSLKEALPYVARSASLSVDELRTATGVGIKTVDPSLSLPASSQDAVFRALQLRFRVQAQNASLSAFLQDPSHAKSILARSATAVVSGRRKDFAGREVYGFITALRRLILEFMEPESLDLLDQVARLVGMVEMGARSATFDYSSVNLLASWIRDAVQAEPELANAEEVLNRLAQTLQLTTGLAQTEIWTAFQERVVARLSSETVAKVDTIRDADMRKSLFQALLSANDASDSDLAELGNLVSSSNSPKDESSSRWSNHTLADILALGILADKSSPSFELLLTQTAMPLSRLRDLHVATNSSDPGALFGALSDWLDSVWKVAAYDRELSGPAALLGPAQLGSVLRFESNEMIRLCDIPGLDKALRCSTQAVFASTSNGTRLGALHNVALNALQMLLSAISNTNALPTNEAEFKDISPEPVRIAVETHLAGPLSVLHSDHTESTVGDLYLGISGTLLDLYVTNIPIDPSVRRLLQEQVVDEEIAELSEELSAVEDGEVRLKGISDSPRLHRVADRLASAETIKSQLGPAPLRQSDPARLAQLFAEVHAFTGDMLGAPVQSLRDALFAVHHQALAREASFQAAAESFLLRLTTIYADFADLIKPIVLAVRLARLGLRCHARVVERRQQAPLKSVELALSFPVVRAASGLVEGAAHVDTHTALLSALATCSNMHSAENRVVETPVLFAQLDAIYQIWSEARTKERQDEQAKESLFRVRKTEIEVKSDIEQEENELAELFPTYDNLEVQRAEKQESTAHFTDHHVATFHSLVLAAAVDPSSVTNDFTLALRAVVRHKYDPRAYGETVDASSVAYQVDLLRRRLAATQSTSTPPNFYLDANEPEIRKAHDLVSRLHRRLELLIEEWPEQMVLQHLRDRVVAYLALDIQSPVALILSALEQLLQHTDDWETFANKENSLRVFQADASALIISWRRLELGSWNRLLDDQFAQYIAKDAEWTIRLYGSLISATSGTDDIAKHVEGTLPLLSTFLQNSTMGHLASRLKTLDALAKIASSSKAGGDSGRNLDTIATVLHNIIANTRLLSPKIDEQLRTQRATVDKAIKDYIKLASWKDVNVHALRASAQKSHRQLHKNIRKFRELLMQPIAPLLADPTAVIGQESPQLSTLLRSPVFKVSTLLDGQSTDSTRPHLINLSDTFGRFARLHQNIVASLPVAVGESIDGMAVDIIETAAELAKATPSTLTKENTKTVNNLASRKRKAFADLLKALRASGFSNNVRADALARQQSNTWLTQRPVIDASNLPEGFALSDVQKIGSYHTRLAALMAVLRAAFNGHNPDIASQDLQRGIGFAESVYACALAERDRLVANLATVRVVAAKIARLQTVADHPSSSHPLVAITRAATTCAKVHCALVEIEQAVIKHRELQQKTADQSIMACLGERKSELSTLQISFEATCASARASNYNILSRDEVAGLTTCESALDAVCKDLGSLSETYPEFRYLFGPVANLVVDLRHTDTLINQSTLDSVDNGDEVIQALLVVTQGLGEISKEDDAERPHIPQSLSAQRTAAAALRMTAVIDKVDMFVANVPSDSASQSIKRILPFLETLAETFAQTISTQAFTIKSIYKLCYVVGRVMLDLAQKGFCKPSEESDSQDDGDGETMEGTGMGSGTGDKNVSNEIEEESQVEGLQGEKEEEGEREEKEGDDDAVDMEDDFEGALEDGKEAEEGEEGDEDGEEERDDHAGDVDPLDPGAVDEKFWGEQEEQEGKDGGNEQMDQQTQETGEAEMSAKDDKESKGEKKEQNQEMGESAPEGEEAEKFEEYDDGEEQDAPETEENAEDQPAGPDQNNVNVPEGDKLDLPEDINLDGDDMGSDLDAEDDLDLPPDENDDGEPQEGDDIDMASQDDGDIADDAPAPTGVGEEDTMEQEEAMAQDLDLSASNEANAQETADQGQGAGGQTDAQPVEKDGEQAEHEEGEQDAQAEPQGQGAQAQDPSSGPTDQNQGEGPVDSSGAPLPNDATQPQSNRTLGDIMQEIRRRQDEILSQQERDNEVSNRDEAQAEAPGQVEYLHDDDQDEGKQALGAAGEEERQKLQDLNIVDEEAQDEAQDIAMDDTEEGDSTPRESRPDDSRKPDQPTDSQAGEKALTQSDVMSGREAPVQADQMDIDAEEGEVEPTRDVEEQVSDDIDLNIIDLPETAVSTINADEQWRYYAGLTSDLSYALCEQLRLILEPTLATRLQGDFRTGKRLNMRKIIPYIASEYTKDKIWLRRTKPSRREYQVLLSLDDSRSMSESHSVDLAYQTLALVAQALNKLEVGQIGIAKFGEGVDILHPFGDAGFTDADGAKVMSSFKFDQHKTDVAALVERTLSFLSESRQKQSSTSAPDLWQLQIIISDGVCQDHHRLRTLLRRALEERVMIVFLVIDSLRQTDPNNVKGAAGPIANRPSILSMQTVEYKNVKGEMQLEMTRYLDTFPFEYYVVLRDVEALPGVLSDTLRQWMARVSQSQE